MGSSYLGLSAILQESRCLRVKPLGDDDLVINLILLPESAETILDKTLPGKCDLASFLVTSLYNQSYSNYMCFYSRGYGDISLTVTNLIREYIDNSQTASGVMAEGLIHQLFALLWRFSVQFPEKVHGAFTPKSNIAMIISHIRDNCKTCTRKSIAQHFYISESRLSNLLSEEIRKGPIRLRNEFRLINIDNKLRTTCINRISWLWLPPKSSMKKTVHKVVTIFVDSSAGL